MVGFGPWKVLDQRSRRPSIPVADRGGEEVDVGFGDFGDGSRVGCIGANPG
jgi:hypothetical protein